MKSFIRCILVFSLLLVTVTFVMAQSRNTGEVRGLVTDSSGAALPGATVTLTNIETGEVKTFVTNGQGLYDTVSTPTGTYNIAFTANGFKRLVQGPVLVQVNVITENAALEIGQATETVNVTAEGAPLLETETSKQGAILEAKTIGELPQIGAGITGNDWANFNIFLPGASSAPSQPVSEGSGAYNAGDAVSINGNLPNYANYLQDGGVVQLPVSNNVDNTLFEAVQEVQVTTSSFSAEYGIGGAVFNQITKGGTNTWHGSGYEYWQNDILNARPHFGIPNSSGGFTPQKVGKVRYHEYGGSIGGPIIKNKAFVFFVVDKIYSNGNAAATLGNTPALAEIGKGAAHPGALDFTGLPTLYDPTSCSTPGCTRTSFAQENTGSLAGVNAIPGNRIDPVAAKILNLYPAPNAGAAGAFSNNFSTVLPNPNPNLRFFGRIDYDVAQKHRVSFSMSQKDNPAFNKGGPFACPINCFSGDIDGYNVQATETWTISPTKVNEFRMAYTKQGNWFVPQSKGFDAAGQLGLQYAKADILPTITINGNGFCCSTVQPGTNAIYIEHLYDPSDVFTMIHGRHVLHFGGEVLMGQGNTTPWGNLQSGNFTFTGNYTAQNGQAATTGTGLADFLLGDAQKWSATNQSTSYNRLKSPQFFVQDDFKLRSNLTLNLGLRYVGTTGFHETHGALGGFDPNLTLSCTVDTNGKPCGSLNGQPGGIWFATDGNGRDSLQKPIWDIFLPRVGFAWQVMNNTVVRGGFGMYSYNFSQDTYGNGIGFGSLGTSTGNASDVNSGTGSNPLISLSASAATAASVLNYTVGSPKAKTVANYINVTSPSNSVPYMPYNTDPGRINEWQLSIEHQFAQSYMAEIAYVGSHATNLQYPTDLNQITSATGLADSIANNKFVQADRPFPAFGNLSGNLYKAISNYNAMQLQLTKRYATGLTFNVNYVWSHMQDEQDSSGWGNRGGTQVWQIGNNPGANYGNSNFDIRNAFKGYASYELPFGKGKTYLNSNKLVSEFAGGWRLAGTFITQSGNPYTVTTSNNLNSTYTGCGNGCSWFPNVVGPTGVSDPGPSQWFNTAAFVPAASGGQFAFGNERRNSLIGPRLSVVNLSIAKAFTVTERVRMEFRSDWVNALNHPSLNRPGNSLGGANFGQINNATQGNGVAVAPRSGQLSLKVTF
ncbi:MAG TPA: carboxypeptidase-like regulatory domain-containing protein [Terriglobales bacterium]|nr:carboxypeptidase-like regulatory domain-containing protein [Terriglobales bacterium]